MSHLSDFHSGSDPGDRDKSAHPSLPWTLEEVKTLLDVADVIHDPVVQAASCKETSLGPRAPCHLQGIGRSSGRRGPIDTRKPPQCYTPSNSVEDDDQHFVGYLSSGRARLFG